MKSFATCRLISISEIRDSAHNDYWEKENIKASSSAEARVYPVQIFVIDASVLFVRSCNAFLDITHEFYTSKKKWTLPVYLVLDDIDFP